MVAELEVAAVVFIAAREVRRPQVSVYIIVSIYIDTVSAGLVAGCAGAARSANSRVGACCSASNVVAARVLHSS